MKQPYDVRMHNHPPATGAQLAPLPYDWATEFHAFTPQHWLTLAAFFGLMAGACWLGWRWRGQRRERILRHAWIWTTIAWQSAAVVWYFLPANFEPYESWPLHLCDLAAWVAPFALLTQRRWLRSLLYFWGLGLSTQAFFTPVVEGGFGTIRYWLFFVGHTHIVGSALYDMIALGYRPTLRDWGVVTLITLAWLAAVTAINIAFDVNYGYSGNTKPGGRTLIDFLGPWPWRIGTLFLAGQVALGLAYLPWAVVRGLKAQSSNLKAQSSKLK
jgi:hypothetical integral membrane protein (TIGR02206 family)